MGQAFTFRAVAVGLFVGTLMCLSNMYFGLQSGWITMGSLQSAILGFGIFKLLNAAGFCPGFSEEENVIVQTTSVATATMPLAAGFVGVIPAMAMLTPDENPPLGAFTFTNAQLVVWALTLAFMGVFVAVPLRSQVIEREKLKFPSGTATAHVIRALHASAHTASLPPQCTMPLSLASGCAPDAARCGSAAGARLLRMSVSWGLEHPELEHGDEVSSPKELELPVSAGNSNRRGLEQTAPPTVSVSGRLFSASSACAVVTSCLVRPCSRALKRMRSRNGALSTSASVQAAAAAVDENEMLNVAALDVATMRKVWKALAYSFTIAFGISVLVGALQDAGVPSTVAFLGSAAGQYGWRLGANAGYIGQGMIMGPRVCASMLVGAIVAFGMLAPMAVHRGWADLESKTDSPLAWVTWISLAMMITDSISSLGVLVVGYALSALRRTCPTQTMDLEEAFQRGVRVGTAVETLEPRSSSQRERVQETASVDTLQTFGTAFAELPPVPALEVPGRDANSIPLAWWLPGLLVAQLVAVLLLSHMFSMPAWQLAVGMVLAMLVAVLAVRALGQTDINPVSGIGKITQVIFAALSPGHLVPNLVAGAVSEAAAQQAGDIMQDFKTAHLLGVSARAQFFAMLIGSFASCWLSAWAFILYSSVYTIGGPELPAPSAFIWLDMARLLTGGSLPAGVVGYCWFFGVLGALLAAAPQLIEWGKSQRQKNGRPDSVFLEWCAWLLPSGIGFAIGMFLLPQFVLPRVLGSVFEQLWLAFSPKSHTVGMLVTASGLVLGEGIASLILTLAKSFLQQ